MVGGAETVARACEGAAADPYRFDSGTVSRTAGPAGDRRDAARSAGGRAGRLRSRQGGSRPDAAGYASELNLCILRPGLVVGEGGIPFHSGLGFFNNEQHCIGWNAGRNPLPFVLVEDVADAIVRAVRAEGIEGRCYNLVGDVRLSAREYIAALAEAMRRPLKFHPQSVAPAADAGLREIPDQAGHRPRRGTTEPARSAVARFGRDLRLRRCEARPRLVARSPTRRGSASARSWCMPADPAAGRAPLLLHVFSTFAVGGPQMRFAALAAHSARATATSCMAMDGDHACAARLAPGLDVRCEPIEVAKGATLRQRPAVPPPAARDRSRSAGDLQLGRDRVGDGEHPAPSSGTSTSRTASDRRNARASFRAGC